MTWTIPLSNKWRGVVFAAAGVIGLGAGIYALYQDHLLAKHGVRADAFVTGKEDTCSYRYCEKRLHIEFESRDGQSVTSAEDVHHSIWSRLSPGDRVPVTYVLGSPKTYRFELHSNRRQAHAKRYGFGFGALFVLIGLGFLFAHRMESSRWRLD